MDARAEKSRDIDSNFPIEDARRLLQALAEEEYPRESFDWDRIKLVCSHPEHRHNNFDGSLGLSLTQTEKPRLRVRCYGHCNFGRDHSGRFLSDYLAQLGPLVRGRRAGQIYFFDQGNAARIVAEFRSKGTCRLGWASWKAQNGLAAPEQIREANVTALKRVSPKAAATPQKLCAESRVHLGVFDERALQLACQLRRWEPDTVRQMLAELRIGLRYVASKDDVLMAAACTGFLPNPSGSNARAIKFRYLKDKASSWMTAPGRTVKFCDYTRPGCEASLNIFICEGEMDAISLRSIYPDARILFPMGLWQYHAQSTLELVPNLALQGKDICLCLDRDLDKGKPTPTFLDQVAYKAFVEAVSSQAPRILATWMCPEETGKDVNDWQKMMGNKPFTKSDLRVLVSPRNTRSTRPIWPDFVNQMNSYLQRSQEPRRAQH